MKYRSAKFQSQDVSSLCQALAKTSTKLARESLAEPLRWLHQELFLPVEETSNNANTPIWLILSHPPHKFFTPKLRLRVSLAYND